MDSIYTPGLEFAEHRVRAVPQGFCATYKQLNGYRRQ